MLEMKQSEADTALVNIQTSMQEAAERRTEVERLRVQLSASEATLHAQHGAVHVVLLCGDAQHQGCMYGSSISELLCFFEKQSCLL